MDCLVTLNETTFAVFGTQNVYCGQRTSPIYGDGVMITISYPVAVPPDYGTSLTLWQQGATNYRAPIVCSAAQIPDCL